MSIQLRWLGTACFEIRLSDGKALMIDPYIDDSQTCSIQAEEIERADLICITHGHFDHLLDVGSIANRLGSTVICSREVARNIQDRFHVPPGQVRTVTAGDSIQHASIKVEAMRAVHIDNRTYFAKQLGCKLTDNITTEDMVKKVFSSIDDPSTKKRLLSHMGKYPAGEQLNYIFQFPGNLRLYFFGSVPDTALLPLVEASGAQILVLQLLRGMEEKAVEVGIRSGAALIFPSHHDPFFPGQKVPDLAKVRALFEKQDQTRFVEAQPGKWYEIGMTVSEL